jgi:threonine synthase
MGLPVKRFIAATNLNHIVPDYLETGIYTPKPSVTTISNAMDVGNPSNFTRILDLYNNDIDALRKDITGFWLNDEDTKAAMKDALKKYNYICDPHGAIGYQSLQTLSNDELGIFLETAHPAKFLTTVQETLNQEIKIPDSLAAIKNKDKISFIIDTKFDSLRAYLMER